MDKDTHKKLGIQAFNKTWDYIDLKERTKEQELDMIHHAHASRYHWGFAGTELNKVRGEWQISRVYSLLGMGESALFHAKACYESTLENGFGDFDLVFAHEAMAFAYKVLGEEAAMLYHLDEGYNAIDQVEKKGDKDYCKAELDNIKK